jgi:hypothetical protein
MILTGDDLGEISLSSPPAGQHGGQRAARRASGIDLARDDIGVAPRSQLDSAASLT